MRKYEYKNFLSLLAKTRNLLVYDDGLLLKEYKDTLDMFESYRYNNINETSVENVSRMLVSMHIDMVLIYAKSSKNVLELCREIAQYDRNIVITVILEERDTLTCKHIMNLADTLLSVPFEPEELCKKLSIALAAKLMIYEMSHTLNTHKKFMDDTGIENYLDTYTEEIKLISARLSILVGRLQSGELGCELFYEIAEELEVISKIFGYHHYTAHLTSIFDEMSGFLRIYSFDNVDLSTLEGFDFLVEILKDIQNYLENFFIKRIFSDVYVFEHSLQDTIQFMVNHLLGKKESKSDLEFFDD